MQSLRKTEAAFLQALLGDATIDEQPRDRVDVYRNNFFEGHRKALAATYPVIARLVGDACFRTLAHDYALGFPSRAGDLAQFGGEFAFFLRGHYGNGEHAYLVDVARLEWAYLDALNAADAIALDLARLASALDGERIGFTFQPAMRLIRSRFPVLAIWQAHQREDDFAIDLSAGEDRLLMHRPQFEVEFLALDPAQYAFVEELYHGQALARALDHAMSIDSNFDLAACLALLITHRVLADCKTIEPPDSEGDPT